MKRAEIQKQIDAGVTEFMVARYDRTKGIDCESANPVRIATAAPAHRKIYHTWGGSHLEDKATGVETFYADDANGRTKGFRSVVQPQDVIATREAWEARMAEKKAARQRSQNVEQAERDAAQKIVAGLMDATGFVGADMIWHKGRAPGYRASVSITLEMADSITKLIERLVTTTGVEPFVPDESDVAAMSDRDFR